MKITLILIVILISFSMIFPLNTASKTVNTVVITIEAENDSTKEDLHSSLRILIERIHKISIQSGIEGEISDKRIILTVRDIDDNKTELLEELMQKKGKMYIEFQGEIIATNSDIVRVLHPVIRESNGGWIWQLPFRISEDAAQRFADAVKGKAGYPVDIFVDPPENCLIIMNSELYKMISSSSFNAITSDSLSLLDRIQKAFKVSVISFSPENESEIITLAESSKKVVLVGVNGNLKKKLKMKGIAVVPFDELNENRAQLISRALGLYGPYSLGEGLTTGRPVMDMMITGSTPTKEEALKESIILYAMLGSKPLPIQLKIVSIGHTTTVSSLTFKAPNGKRICGVGSLMLMSMLLLVILRRGH
ncbi:hypothetical protein [Thermococcus sp.]